MRPIQANRARAKEKEKQKFVETPKNREPKKIIRVSGITLHGKRSFNERTTIIYLLDLIIMQLSIMLHNY